MERTRQRDHPLARLARTFIVLVIGIAVLVALTFSHPGAPTDSSSSSVGGTTTSLLSATPITLSTRDEAHVGCPSGVSYTSDGLAFAFLGSAADCAPHGAAAHDTQTLVIVDATFGQVIASIPLDPLVLTGGLSPSAASEVQSIRYASLGWSPDSQTFAVAYIAFDAANSFFLPDSLGSGLVLVNRTRGAARVLQGDAGFFSAATASYSGLPIWNTAQGVATPPVSAPPSLSYAWKSGPLPEPITPLGPNPLNSLPVSAGPRYPVGRPSQDATFTIWQPGVVLGPRAVPTGAAQFAGDGAFVTSFTTWSPDGTYVTLLVAGVSLAWPGGTSAVATTSPQPAPAVQAPTTLIEAPARDAALKAVEQEVGQNGWALVAWNPAGSLLATMQCTDAHAPRLEFRSTITGAILGQASVHLSAQDPACDAASFDQPLGAYANPNLRLLWSPDGSRILLSDQAANTVTEWTVPQN